MKSIIYSVIGLFLGGVFTSVAAPSISLGVEAKKTVGSAESKLFSKTITRYRKAKLVTMDIEQKTVSVLGKEKVYTGKAYLSGVKFRIENKDTENSTIVFDQKVLWREVKQPPEAGGEIQVAKSEVAGRSQDFFFVSYLMKNSSLAADAKFLPESSTETLKVFQIVNDKLSAKSLKVTLNSAQLKIVELEVVDDIDQVSKVNFKNIEFSKVGKASLFKYTPPKGIKVVEL